MSKKVYITIIILTLLLCGSIVFLGLSIRYGLTHQATKHSDGLDLREERMDPISEFVVETLQ